MANSTKKPGIISGAAWVGSSRVAVRLLGLISTFVLARLLVPEDFGLVAIASGVIGLLQSFSDLSFNQALIRFQEVDDDDYSTAWTLNLLRGMLLCLLLLALAYPLSLSLDDARLFLVLIVVSVIPLAGGLENPRLILFEKQLRFDVLFRVMVITKLSGVLVTIVLACLWRSYWVLIIGMITTTLMRTLLSFFYAKGKLRFAVSSWKKIFGFSGWVSGEKMLTALGARLDPIILAYFVTPHVVGLLHIARELSYMSFTEIVYPLRRVLYPALSTGTTTDEEFINTYKKSVGGLFFVLAPVCVGFALTVPDLIPVVLGQGWLETIVPIQILTLSLGISILGQATHSATMAKGVPRYLFYGGLIIAPIRLAIFFVLVMYYGFYGAVFGISFGILLTAIVHLFISKMVTGIGMLQHVLLVKRSLLPLLAMCGAVYGLSALVFADAHQVGTHILRLVVMVPVGVLVYSAAYYVLWIFWGKPAGPERALVDYLAGFAFCKNIQRKSTG
mgnify:CR=1 FL=1